MFSDWEHKPRCKHFLRDSTLDVKLQTNGIQRPWGSRERNPEQNLRKLLVLAILEDQTPHYFFSGCFFLFILHFSAIHFFFLGAALPHSPGFQRPEYYIIGYIKISIPSKQLLLLYSITFYTNIFLDVIKYEHMNTQQIFLLLSDAMPFEGSKQ